MSRSVKVTIAGHSFSVKTDSKPKYVKDLATLVTERMEAINKSSRIGSTHTLALLTALSIADDLQQERDALAKLKREVKDRSQKILRALERGDES